MNENDELLTISIGQVTQEHPEPDVSEIKRLEKNHKLIMDAANEQNADIKGTPWFYETCMQIANEKDNFVRKYIEERASLYNGCSQYASIIYNELDELNMYLFGVHIKLNKN